MDPNTPPVAACSAPGKVLLAGGYLVLDREFTGLVFGLDARIHVHVQRLSDSPNVDSPAFVVRSPQFRDAEWHYHSRRLEEGRGSEVTQLLVWARCAMPAVASLSISLFGSYGRPGDEFHPQLDYCSYLKEKVSEPLTCVLAFVPI